MGFWIVVGIVVAIVAVLAVLASRNGRRADPGRRDDVLQNRLDVEARSNPMIGGQRDDWSGHTRR